MFELYAIWLPTIVYTLGFLKVWRHLGWYATYKLNGCYCGAHCRYNYRDNKKCLVKSRCGDHNPCLPARFWAATWSFVASAVVWWAIAICRGIWILEKKNSILHDHGFFKPPSAVETKDEKISRLEREAVEREKHIRRMEIEAGIAVNS